MPKITRGATRIESEDLARLRRAVGAYNASVRAQQAATIRLEACKLDMQERYRLQEGQTIDLTTGDIT